MQKVPVGLTVRASLEWVLIVTNLESALCSLWWGVIKLTGLDFLKVMHETLHIDHTWTSKMYAHRIYSVNLHLWCGQASVEATTYANVNFINMWSVHSSVQSNGNSWCAQNKNVDFSTVLGQTTGILKFTSMCTWLSMKGNVKHETCKTPQWTVSKSYFAHLCMQEFSTGWLTISIWQGMK